MDLSEIRKLLIERIAHVERRVSSACQRAGRHRSEVAIVAVTKQITAEVARLLPDLGIDTLGESRPQEMWHKVEVLAGLPVTWHFIGHLQRNKIERTLPLAAMIHSVDSRRLLESLEVEAAKLGRVVPILLEVNASGEASKQGFEPDAISDLVPRLNEMAHLQIRGLMTMAAPENDPEMCRPTFALLRRLRNRIQKKLSPAHEFHELSMGMTHDFEVAIEEGATFVRLGSVYFEGLDSGGK